MTENKYCLHPEYLIELLNFIGVMTFKTKEAAFNALKEKRRQLYRQEAWNGYTQTVRDEFRLENEAQEKVTADVLAALQLKKQDLAKSEQMLVQQQPQCYRVVEICRQGGYPLPTEKNKKPTMTQEETLTYARRLLILTQESRTESRKLLHTAALAQDRESMEALFVKDLVCKSKTNDKFFDETGIEPSDLNKDIQLYYSAGGDFSQKHYAMQREVILATTDDLPKELSEKLD